MIDHFLQLDEGDKTMLGDKTLEVVSQRRTAASVTKWRHD